MLLLPDRLLAAALAILPAAVLAAGGGVREATTGDPAYDAIARVPDWRIPASTIGVGEVSTGDPAYDAIARVPAWGITPPGALGPEQVRGAEGVAQGALAPPQVPGAPGEPILGWEAHRGG
jgi:hypothetical protein